MMSRSAPPVNTKFVTFDMKLEKIGTETIVKGKPQKILKPDTMVYAQNWETESGELCKSYCLTNKKEILIPPVSPASAHSKL